MAVHDLRVGVLALQGDVEAHCLTLGGRAGVSAVPVRTADEVASVDGLVFPGGESTTIGKLLDRVGLLSILHDRIAGGFPVYGTCAGMILLATDIVGSDQHRIGVLNVSVARNAFGRQIDSFEAAITMPDLGGEPVHGVFIRAPYVVSAGADVKVLAEYRQRIVAVRQGNILATAFHPELTTDRRVHDYFVDMVRATRG